MPKTVTAPDVLPAKAKEIWRAAFLSAYDSTCEKRSDREACAAKIAWAAVKNTHKKGKAEKWVEKTLLESGIDTGNIPVPGGFEASSVFVYLTWAPAFTTRLKETSDSARAAVHAWAILRDYFAQNDSGLWVERDDVEIPDIEAEIITDIKVSPAVKNEVDPIVVRAVIAGAAYQVDDGPIVLRNATPEEEQSLLERGHGNEPADRPGDYPIEKWMSLSPQQKTVGAIIQLRMVSRAYMAAVEDVRKRGWTALVNPNWASEFIFKGWRFPEGRPQEMVRAVLVRKTSDDGTESNHWYLFEIRSSAVKPPFGEARFRGPLLKT